MTGLDRPTGSPFDAIRHADESGEFWVGRELQPVMDYARWHEFATVVDKAKASLALVQGPEAAEYHFGVCHSDGGRWGNQQLDDFRLTRFAAYLTAMAGDDTKGAVARARVYFAVRTREAEVKAAAEAAARPSTAVVLPEDYEQALEALLIKVRENKALKSENAKLQVKAAAFDDWINGKGCYLIGTVAKMLGLGPKLVWDFLYDEKILIASGSRRREPYASKPSTAWFEVKPRDLDKTNGHATNTTYMSPYGAEQLRLLLIKRGILPPQQLALIGGAS